MLPMPVALFLMALFALLQTNRPPIVQSIDVDVPVAPAVFTQDGRAQLVYELHITNTQQVDVTLTALRAASAHGTLAEYRDSELQRRITRPGLRNDHATPHIVGPGMRAVVNLWMALPQSVAVTDVTHTIELEVKRPAGTVRASVESIAAVRWPQAPLILDAPLKGGHWVAIYDPLLKGGHRTAIYTVDGRARIPGRFAIDFISLPPAGVMVRDPGVPLQERNGFGADVLAVADGTIASALDDTPDDLPQPVSPERASGNCVSIDLGGGRFAFYEHLQQGSVRVKTGEQVKRGQVIAKLGASGSTSIGPHLHFHVADRNSLLGAEGVPFVFSRFTTFGAFASIDALVTGAKWQPAQLARPSATTRPAPNAVISFP
jgi:murein DD-endopeptidase